MERTSRSDGGEGVRGPRRWDRSSLPGQAQNLSSGPREADRPVFSLLLYRGRLTNGGGGERLSRQAFPGEGLTPP